mgnify:CR=1 FL=1
MLTAGLYILGVVLLGGLILSGFVLGGERSPRVLARAHGLGGAAGIAIAAIAVLQGASPMLVGAIAVLMLAAAGGVFISHFHPRAASPELAVILHAIAGGTGVAMLWLGL